VPPADAPALPIATMTAVTPYAPNPTAKHCHSSFRCAGRHSGGGDCGAQQRGQGLLDVCGEGSHLDARIHAAPGGAFLKGAGNNVVSEAKQHTGYQTKVDVVQERNMNERGVTVGPVVAVDVWSAADQLPAGGRRSTVWCVVR
jgi:hypothetical protein